MHRSLIVNFHFLLLAAIITPIFASAQISSDPTNPFNYAEAVALVKEREPASDPRSNEWIYVLGPERLAETRIVDGKEIRLNMPYCRAFPSPQVKNPQRIFGFVRVDDSQQIQLLVYQANQSQPTVRIEGPASEVRSSQFPLKSGDVVVITDKGKQASAKK